MAADHSRIRDSPTVWMATVLVVVYLLTGILGGNLIDLNLEFAYPFLQVNQAVWSGAIWMLFTSLFLHANPLHLIGNVFFLLIFGTSLEEKVSRRRWLITYFVSGLAGNIAFLFLGGNEIGLGSVGSNMGHFGCCWGVKGLGWDAFLHRSKLVCGWRGPCPRWRSTSRPPTQISMVRETLKHTE